MSSAVSAAGFTSGPVFRGVNKGDRITGGQLSTQTFYIQTTERCLGVRTIPVLCSVVTRRRSGEAERK
jgi:hypothetical protein